MTETTAEFLLFSATQTAPGGGDRTRTDDPLLAKQVLSQLSYAPGTVFSRQFSESRQQRAGGRRRPTASLPHDAACLITDD